MAKFTNQELAFMVENPDAFSIDEIKKAHDEVNSNSLLDTVKKGLDFTQRVAAGTAAKALETPLTLLSPLISNITGKVVDPQVKELPKSLSSYLAQSTGIQENPYTKAMGFVGEAAADPLNIVPLPKVPLLGGLGKQTEKLGSMVYKSAFKKIDEMARTLGKKNVPSELFEKAGTKGVGTTKKMYSTLVSMKNNALDTVKNTIEKVNDKANVNLAETFKPVVKQLTEMLDNPEIANVAQKELEIINQQIGKGLVSLKQAQKMKQVIGKITPKTSFDPEGTSSVVAQIKKMKAESLKNAIIDSANKAEAGAGNIINEANQVFSTLQTVAKPLRNIAKSATNKNAITSVDAILTGALGLGTGNVKTALGALAIKKAADASKTTIGRTLGGTAIKNVVAPYTDALARKGIYEYGIENEK